MGRNMAMIHIVSLLAAILLLSYGTKEKVVDCTPIAVGVLVLLLYFLAFFRGLFLIDYISIIFLLVLVVCFVLQRSEKKKAVLQYVREAVLHPGTLILFFTLITVSVCVSGKVVTWWDDYNFWATDVKSLFYLNGFAEKYANVAAEFGDYPPGTQLLKWWFLHLSPGQFGEGLMFAGYYCMNLVFMAPLLRYVRGRNPLILLLAAYTLWIFPSLAEVFYTDGCCADLTMAVLYGGFLIAVLDRKGHTDSFYFGRLALYLMVLVLTKNVAFLWVAFGLVFLWGYHLLKYGKKNLYSLFAVTLCPMVVEGSWLLFCLLNRRVAKLTGTAISMATGDLSLPDTTGQLVRAFCQAFISWPLHRWKTVMIDLSPLALMGLILLFLLILSARRVRGRREMRYITVFLMVNGILFYGINLASHLTIFAIEEQYLEPYGMVSSIERYGAPFTIGSLMVIAFLYLEKEQPERRFPAPYTGLLVCCGFVLLTADHNSAYRGLIGYRDSVAETLEERDEVLDTEAETFLQTTQQDFSGQSVRVLYLRDQDHISWVGNTYVNFEAAPVSVMHGTLNGETMTAQQLSQAIEEAHAGYVYVDQLGTETKLLNEFTVDGAFQYQVLYRVIETSAGMRLQKWEDS